jgi:hypothetical protein
MHAVRLHAFGPPENLIHEELFDPVPGEVGRVRQRRPRDDGGPGPRVPVVADRPAAVERRTLVMQPQATRQCQGYCGLPSFHAIGYRTHGPVVASVTPAA